MNTLIILSSFKGTKAQFYKAIVLTFVVDALVVLTCFNI